MHISVKTLVIAALFALPFASHSDHHDHAASEPHGQHGASQTTAMGTGVVHSVDSEDRKINLTHDPIPALRWPAMTMDLDVADSVDLSRIAAGEEIEFQVELGEDQVYRITEIMKAGESN